MSYTGIACGICPTGESQTIESPFADNFLPALMAGAAPASSAFQGRWPQVQILRMWVLYWCHNDVYCFSLNSFPEIADVLFGFVCCWA